MENDAFRDPIHGFIEVNDYEKEIIDSAPFQRLRNIKQLAMTNYIYHGAEHTRFGHSLGVMHLVTRAFNAAIKGNEDKFPDAKRQWCRQVLRLIALTHDIGHAPFSHASESLFPEEMQHEDFTVKIIMETVVADIIQKIGSEFVSKYGEEYRITPQLLCDIYMGKNVGPNYEYLFLKSFMDSELDCDKMDYLLRDSYYCGVKYGMYDIDRLINSFTIYYIKNVPRLAIRYGGVQAFEEFVLARYFMFIQVYFHRTRRYFDIMLGRALKNVLPNGIYPKNVSDYLEWDDHRVIQLIKECEKRDVNCKNIINRIVYPEVFSTKTHPQEADKRDFKRIKKILLENIGADNIIEDNSAAKMPHKIPTKVEIENERAIIIYDEKTNQKKTITEESEIICSLTEKIDLQRLYCHPEYREAAFKIVKEYNTID